MDRPVEFEDDGLTARSREAFAAARLDRDQRTRRR